MGRMLNVKLAILFICLLFFFSYFFILTDKKSVEKACNAMVPNPIFEGTQCESIQPEVKNLTTPHPTAEYTAV